ncbi:hypothetical protein NEAUS04_1558 [Nematocida ausubeli]|uniref:Uncharacterized protein n=1 Tax=Nematocida ausubeli (strain ATCC PRA-371 / ERTm2) TaxID=1913371 RepID=A0A086J5J3_NEMA1|nr:uncharacterized protein NESG_00489 [Nematocida ausubeli]KAI5136850.1 hypothetical protein NEAUS06_2045 [Nematocida ausubeli]KAI5149247.1 hypothetical protein NEAUS05_1695 [Nematocida ausubeli]KAI5163430.1 hypothetical protein NEAUS04_1558 [Nematocida ausubeli]KFG27411.1 hypothetical protein NESG_00489 [Nematocida ausubeli]
MDSKEKKQTKRKQAHQNTFAFRHNPNSSLTKEIAAIKISGLCRRCTDKIDWRKKYRKYKIQTHVSRCTVCLEKSITKAYNIVCEPCGEAKTICRMCKVVLCFETCAPLEQVLAAQKKENTAAPEKNPEEVKTAPSGVTDEQDLVSEEASISDASGCALSEDLVDE